MANTLTDAVRNEASAWLFRGTPPTVVPSLYAALLTADPGASGDLSSEVAAVEYSRQLVAFNAGATAGQSVASTIVLFPNPVTGWGTVTWVALCDTATGGTVRVKASLATPVGVLAGESPTFNIGNLSWTVTG